MKKSAITCGPLRFAHRGLVQAAPENTIEAFKAAIDFGCEGIELDVRLSKDGVPIVVHDQTLNRMTDGKLPGRVEEYDSDVLTSVDIPYAGHLLPYAPPEPYSENEGSVRTYTPEQIEEFRRTDRRVTHLSTFEQFDKWFEGVTQDVTIEIEICADDVFPALYPILCRSKNLSRYIVFSGRTVANRLIQDICREKGKPEGLRLGSNIRKLTDETREFIKTADLYEVGMNDGWFTKEDAQFINSLGIKIFSNLGDYPEWWASLEELNCVAFKTNYAQAYTDWAKQNR